MASRLETIYQWLPAGAQNAALSVYGLHLLRTRYSGNYPRYLDEAIRRGHLSAESLSEYVDSCLQDVLRAAVSNVPYYRDRHREGGFPVESVRGVGNLCQLPMLEKNVVRDNPERLVSDRYRLRGLEVIHTTGTSGTPLKIFCNPNVRQRNYAFHDRFLATSGIDRRGLRATIGGRIILPASVDRGPYWRQSYFQRNLLFSSYHLAPHTIEQYIGKLKESKPAHIDAYPSSVYAIADYARDSRISLMGITGAIVTSGETLFEEQRSLIEEQFGVRVFDQYGCAEMSVLVTSCTHGAYHASTDFGVLEILREDGTAAGPGEEGEIVCTGLINDVMPLIRYRIGDRAVADDRTCSCGSPFPTVRSVLGRMDDVIVTPEGNRVGRLSPVLKGFPVKEAQYRQDSVDEVQVLIVADSGYDPETEKRLIGQIRLRLGGTMRIRIERVESIDRGKGGKLKLIVSSLGQSTRSTASNSIEEQRS